MEQGNYARQLLMQLNQQRSKGYLCDVIIVVENALFQAHKNILAASSSYFKSLVLHDNLISLDTEMVSPSVFREVLDFIYTGRLPSSDPISEKGFSALLTAASYLQLSDLAALCHKRLKSSSSSKTVPSSTTSSRIPNGRLSHPKRLSCNPLRVTCNHHSVSLKAERSQKREGCPREDLSEEELYISHRVSISPSTGDKISNVVGEGCGLGLDLGLDLSRKSPTGSAVTDEVSPSSLQQGSPHSGSTNKSVLSYDMPTNSTSALSYPGEEHSEQGELQQHSNTTTESQQKATRKRPWSSSEGSLGMAFNGRGKRQGVVGGVMMQREDGASPELEDQEKDGDGEAVLENHGLGHSEGSGQSESEEGEMNENQNASYIYRQPQAGLELALGDDLYVCVPCGKGFPSSEDLNAHVDTHTTEELYIKVEDENKVGFLKEEDQDIDCKNLPLQSIKEEPDPDPMLPRHICSVCSKSYVDLASLKEHEKSHWLTRPFPCNICGKLFTQRGTMTRHMRSHLGLKPFACEECGMRFTRQYRLTEHMRVHSGEKPYGCQLCGGKFTQQRNLISHLRMHTLPS